MSIYLFDLFYILICFLKKQELLMFLSKAPAFMPADYSFIYLSLFILQSIHLCRYSTYSGFLHIPLPGLSDILATIHSVTLCRFHNDIKCWNLRIITDIRSYSKCYLCPAIKISIQLVSPVKIKTVTK